MASAEFATGTGPRLRETVFDGYVAAILDGDRQAAVALTLTALHDGVPAEAIISELLVPAQAEIGRGWQKGIWNVAQEHRASAITEQALAQLVDAAMQIPGARNSEPIGQTVVACSEGEWHVLPARMATEYLRLQGLEVTLIGPSVPADQLVSLIEPGDVSVVAVTCAMPSSLVGAWRTISALRHVGMTVVCGGRGFGGHGQWVVPIGGDHWAPTFQAGAELLLTEHGRARVAPRQPTAADGVAGEVTTLRRDGPSWVEQSTAIALERWPHLRESDTAVRATREDLASTLQAIGSASIVQDPGLINGFMSWFVDLLRARHLPVEYASAACDLLLEVMPEDVPTLRTMAAAGLLTAQSA